MKLKIISIILTVVVAILLLIGFPFLSYAPRIALSLAEDRLQQKWRAKFNCQDLELRHDYYAVKSNTTNGEFTIGLCDDYCDKDSAQLVSKAMLMAEELKHVLSHQAQYSAIGFYSSVEKQLDERTSEVICSLVIKLEIKDMHLIEYSHYHK